MDLAATYGETDRRGSRAMNQDQRRRVENQLLSMGLPQLDDPALIQVMADMVNAYPIMSERVQFFCDLLNECDAGKRYEMYTAMRPRLSFPVPTFAECETRITQKAERMVGRKTMADAKPEQDALKDVHLVLKCHGCEKERTFEGLTTTDAMSKAKRQGWGRGPVAGYEYCADCRADAMLHPSLGTIYTRRHAL